MSQQYYSLRLGTNPNKDGLPLEDILLLFLRLWKRLRDEGYFDEAFGFWCTDNGHSKGSVTDPELEVMLAIRKKDLWPIPDHALSYSEDDLFDVIEFLFHHVSKPTKGFYHSFDDCGMHWETFSQVEGKRHFQEAVNTLLSHYSKRFELSEDGKILQMPEEGFETIFTADIPTNNKNNETRIASAVALFRRHGSTINDRRRAVRELADVLEYLRLEVKDLLTSADERDLFNIANNFGIRHHNDKQKTAYDASIWLSWMFYFYLATIHVLLRKMANKAKDRTS